MSGAQHEFMTEIRVRVPVGRVEELLAGSCGAPPGSSGSPPIDVDLSVPSAVTGRVEVDLGPPTHHGRSVRWPLSWNPLPGSSDTVSFDGTLMARAAGNDAFTDLRVEGSCGELDDGHSQARAALAQFLDEMAKRLERAAEQPIDLMASEYWLG